MAASLLVALGLAEVVLRLFFAGYVTQIYALDPVMLHRLRPGTEKIFVHHALNGGHRIDVRVNAQGYRGADLEDRAAVRRVAVFGDSCVMGEFSALEHSFCEQLEDRLDEALPGGKPFEVVNAGVVAYGPDQICRKMEAELEPLAPDAVVVAFFTDNDFGDLMRNKMFLLKEGGDPARPECVPHDFVIGAHLREKFGEGLGTTALYRLAKRIYRNSRTKISGEQFSSATPEARRAAGVHQVEQWQEGCRLEYEGYVKKGNREVRLLFEDHFDTDVATRPDSESARYKVRLFTAVLDRIRAHAAELEVPLFVLVIPSPWNLCGPRHGGVVDRDKHPNYVPRSMSDAAANAADSLGIPCVNLFDTFAAKDPESLYLLAPDNHWNDAGQALAARVVRDAMVQRGLLKPAGGSGR